MDAVFIDALSALAVSVPSATSQATADGGLTIGELVANIPHDTAAFVVYAMVIGSALFVWRAGRTKPPEAHGG